MKRRAWFASLGLFAAVLALTVTALAPVALASGSASASASPAAAATAPKGTPIILGTIPDPKGGNSNWTGDNVRINFDPNGADVDANGKPLANAGLDLAKCKLFINGVEQKLTSPPSVVYLAPSNPTLQYLWDKAYPPGSYDLKVTIATQAGTTINYGWKFGSEGSATGGSLINTSVMKQWFWYIARGAIITVELTVISIILASLFALLGALGRLSKKMTFRQAWDRYQSREYMFRMVIGRIPYWIATFYTSLFRGTPLLLQIYVIYLGSPEIIRALGLPDSYNPSPFILSLIHISEPTRPS